MPRNAPHTAPRLAAPALLAAGLAAFAAPALAAEATARVTGVDGTDYGAVGLRDTPSGMVLATLTLTQLPPGTHAVHLHETGDCSAEDFSSAGGHIAGDKAHGVLNADGPHPGDMPNLTVKEDGVGEVEYFLAGLDLEGDLLDEDGSAFVMHQGLDDYESQPAGDAGDRIACGVFEARE